jgi:hypothetical protein
MNAPHDCTSSAGRRSLSRPTAPRPGGSRFAAPPPPPVTATTAAALGGFHGFGCDMERCPHDGSQALTCECEIEEVGS